MLLTLIRDTFTPAETLGKLLIDGKPFCDTLEPPSLMHCIGTECSANIKAMQASSSSQNKQVVSGTLKCNAQHPKGAIPEGWYKIQVTRSPKFGRLLPLLYYVPGFDGIRIHAGNNRDHTSGCILVGNGSWDADGSAAMSDKSEQSCLSDWHTIPALFNSRATEQELVKLLKPYQDARHEMYIEVTDTERYAVERMPQPVPYTFHISR